MRVCSSCGFDSAPYNEPCTLCGATEEPETVIDFGDSNAATALKPTHAVPRPSRLLSRYDPGFLYARRYRIDSFLGRGGMGTVYRVHDLEEKRDAALKILSASIAEDPGGIERFKREVSILSKRRHPAVPVVFGWGMEADEFYYVAEFIDGADLRVEIKKRGPWPPAEAAALVATLCDPLGAAHEHGVIHRDIKPHNIMIANDGAVKLMDFGVARGVGIDMKTITATGAIVGTPEYMSPEQFESHRVDARSDIYSLGVVLFEMLIGQLPFTGETPVSIALKHRAETPPALRQFRKEIPAWLERVVLKCLEKDPAKRFETAADLARALRQPRSSGAPRREKLPTGDWIIQDDDEVTEWALVLSTPKERKEWLPGMALRFRDRFFRLDEEVKDQNRWVYRFGYWPSEEVIRGLVDYDQDAAERAKAADASLSGKFKKLWRS